jgi:hypothetical protein
MKYREERISVDGTRVIHTPERSREFPWTVIWAELGAAHWTHRQISAQAVGTWSTVRATNEKEEIIT